MNWFSDLFHWMLWEASVGLFKMFDYLLSGLNSVTPEFVANVNADSFFGQLMNELSDLGAILIIIFLLIYMGIQFITVNSEGMKSVFRNIFYCFVFFIILTTCVSGIFNFITIFGGVDNNPNERVSVYLANAFIYEIDSGGNKVEGSVIDTYDGLPMEGQEGKDINDTINVNGHKAYKYNYISFFFILIYCIVLYALLFYGVVKIMVHLANLLFHMLMSFIHLAKGMFYGMEALKIYGAEILRLFFAIGVQLLSFMILPHLIIVVVNMNVGIVVLLACLIGLAIFLIDGSDSLTKTLGTDNGASSPLATYMTMKGLKTAGEGVSTASKGAYQTTKTVSQKGGDILKKGGNVINGNNKDSKMDSTLTKASEKATSGVNSIKEGINKASEKTVGGLNSEKEGINKVIEDNLESGNTGNTIFEGNTTNSSNLGGNVNNTTSNLNKNTSSKDNIQKNEAPKFKDSITTVPTKLSEDKSNFSPNENKVINNSISKDKGSSENKIINNNVSKDVDNINQKSDVKNNNIHKDVSNVNQKANIKKTNTNENINNINSKTNVKTNTNKNNTIKSSKGLERGVNEKSRNN